ncbi:MAG: type II toxin-antitoxin system PemK/MazF family toxin [Chitinophagaceae bacterium]|nr:MAG: type II toxin-antitoxin system PemK/MazF family toxin [Chitinophagaceae bacterium]
MKKGDILLIPFPFTDLAGQKNRPALVLFASESDVTLAFITTQTKWQNEYDLLLQPSEINGLKKPSLLRLSKIATLDIDLAIGKLGTLDNAAMAQINHNLIKLLKLENSSIS